MARTNIEIDERLLEEAFRLTRAKTKKELVHRALEDLVKRQRRKRILRLRGKVKWEGNLEEMRTSRV